MAHLSDIDIWAHYEPIEFRWLLVGFMVLQQIISVHKPVKVWLKEVVLDNTIFLKFWLCVLFGILGIDSVCIIEDGTVIAFQKFINAGGGRIWIVVDVSGVDVSNLLVKAALAESNFPDFFEVLLEVVNIQEGPVLHSLFVNDTASYGELPEDVSSPLAKIFYRCSAMVNHPSLDTHRITSIFDIKLFLTPYYL